MREKSEYLDTWRDLWNERSALADQRTNLENELNEVRTRLSHLNEILAHLEPLAGISDFTDSVVGLGITDAIRFVLKQNGGKMSATDVRDSLHKGGYDLASLSAPMSSIYKVLSRLVEDSKEVEREREEKGKVLFRWKDDPAEITDGDIPF